MHAFQPGQAVARFVGIPKAKVRSELNVPIEIKYILLK